MMSLGLFWHEKRVENAKIIVISNKSNIDHFHDLWSFINFLNCLKNIIVQKLS